ncbi:unnamed protein product [Alternaria alternata]
MLCDDLALDDADQTYEVWKRKLVAAQEAIIEFVTKEVKSRVAGEFGGFLEGSYNICLIVKVSAKPTYVKRFPKPGRTAVCFLEEKVRNEVQVMHLLRERTKIPLPAIYTWGTTDDSPSQIGPFIIMEYIGGRRLIEALKQPTETKDGEVDLWKDLGNSRLAKDVLSAARPPAPESSPYSSKRSGQSRRCKEVFIARHRLKQSIDRFIYTNNNTSPFKIYCYDFRPSNMIVDENLNIKAVVNFEFWNALPAQFAHGPPWWLTSLRPDEWIDRGFDFGALKSRLEPHVEQFLQVMEKVEKEKATDGPVALLSVPMRDSWISGRFWFNLAMDDSWTIDAVYWAALHKPGDEVLDEAMEDELKAFYDMKMKQLEAFNAECKERGI